MLLPLNRPTWSSTLIWVTAYFLYELFQCHIHIYNGKLIAIILNGHNLNHTPCIFSTCMLFFFFEYNEKTGGNLALFDDPFLLMINCDDVNRGSINKKEKQKRNNLTIFIVLLCSNLLRFFYKRKSLLIFLYSNLHYILVGVGTNTNNQFYFPFYWQAFRDLAFVYFRRKKIVFHLYVRV